jgi:DNA-binding transcriptional LysR family regulator
MGKDDGAKAVFEDVRSITRTIKRRYPGKQTVVLVPDETVSVRELVDLMVALREDFPRVVFSQGQDLVLP